MIKSFARIFLIVFLGIILNNTIFVHVHLLEDGKIIVHTHPYNIFASSLSVEQKSPSHNTNHSHNKQEFKLIYLLDYSISNYIQSSDFSINKPKEDITQEKVFYKITHYISFFEGNFYLRAPPCCV